MTKGKGKRKRTKEENALIQTKRARPKHARASGLAQRSDRIGEPHPNSAASTTTATAAVAVVAAATLSAEAVLPLVVQSGVLIAWMDVAELQRTSLGLCEACRRCIPVLVRVTPETPMAVWARHHDGSSNSNRDGRRGNGGLLEDGCSSRSAAGIYAKGPRWWRRRCKRKLERQTRRDGRGGDDEGDARGSGSATSASTSINHNCSVSSRRSSRLPRLQILSMIWQAPAHRLGDGSDLPSELRELTFGRDFNRKLDGLVWPAGLERLTFGSKFNRDLARRGCYRSAAPGSQIVFERARNSGCSDLDVDKNREELCRLIPGSLKELTLGKQFNKPLPKNLLPPGLVSLTLGRDFCHRSSVRDAVWPSGLKVLRFGEAMLKLERRTWPRLEAMRGVYDRSGENEDRRRYAWPTSLERVEFWQEGRAVVCLGNGRILEGESLIWLMNN